MSLHRYPSSALVADWLRAGIGLAATVLPLLLLDLHWAVALAFGIGAAMFAAFSLRTWQRQRTAIETTETGVAERGPFGSAAAWSDLASLRLRYFSTRRDRKGGWMHLTLRGRSGRPVRIESTLAGFDGIVERAVEAARANGLALDPATEDNLVALGVDAGDPAGVEPLVGAEGAVRADAPRRSWFGPASPTGDRAG